MARLLLLFVVVPMVELALLIEIGTRLGTPATLALIVGTGTLGAWLARRQGGNTLRRLQAEVQAGRMPAEPLLDGALILFAGAVLITPGILTDLAGFACLVPASRRWLAAQILRRIERAVREGRITVQVATPQGPPGPAGPRPIKNVTPPQSE